MNRHSKSLQDSVCQGGRTQRRILLLLLAKESDNFRGEFVRLVRATFARSQSRQAIPTKCGLDQVKRRARKAERLRHTRYRMAIVSDAPQHLVLDLQPVAGVEECVGSEHLLADILGARVETTQLAQGLLFGIVAVRFRHGSFPL